MASAQHVNRFLKKFCEWAAAEPGLLAAGLAGSYARGVPRPDSDVDLILITRDPQAYLSENRWAEQFGAVRRRQMEEYGKVTSLRVWYSDGLEVEYGFADESWADLPVDPGTRQVVTDGFLILFERRPLLSRLAVNL